MSVGDDLLLRAQADTAQAAAELERLAQGTQKVGDAVTSASAKMVEFVNSIQKFYGGAGLGGKQLEQMAGAFKREFGSIAGFGDAVAQSMGVATKSTQDLTVAATQATKQLSGPSGLSAAFGDITKHATAFTAALVGFQGIRQLGRELRELFGFVAQTEQFRLGVAATVSTAGQYVDSFGKALPAAQQMTISLREADAVLKQMMKDSLELAIPIETLQHAYSITAGMMKSAGIESEKGLRIIEGLVILGQRLNVPFAIMARDVRDIISGTNAQRAILGNALQLTQGMVQAARTRGELEGLLLQKVAGALESAKLNLETWRGISVAIGNSAKVLAGDLLGSMDGSKSAARDVLKVLEGWHESLQQSNAESKKTADIWTQLKQQFSDWWDIINGLTFNIIPAIFTVLSGIKDQLFSASFWGMVNALASAVLTTVKTAAGELSELFKLLGGYITETLDAIVHLRTPDFTAVNAAFTANITKWSNEFNAAWKNVWASFVGEQQKAIEGTEKTGGVAAGFKSFHTEIDKQAKKAAQEQIKGAQDTALALIEIDKIKLKSLLDTHQISSVEYAKQEAILQNKIVELHIDTAKKLLALETEPDKRATAQEHLTKALAQRGVQEAKNTAEVNKALYDTGEKNRKLLEQVDIAEEKAYGNPQQQRMRELLKAHDDLVQKLTDTGDSAMLGAIKRVDAAYAEMIRNAQAGTIDLRQTIEQAMTDAFAGPILGTKGKSWSDWFDGFTQSMKASFAKALAEMILEKIGFDEKLHLNFTKTLPESAAAGASKIGTVFSSVFSLLSGGSGRGTSLSIDPYSGSASWAGGAGSNPFDYGMSTVGGGVMTVPPAGSPAGGSGGLSLGKFLGAGGTGMMAGSLISGLIGGTAGNVIGGAGGGALAGFMVGGPVGALIGGLVGALGGGLSSLFGGGGPTKEHITTDNVKDLFAKSGITRSMGTFQGRSAWGDHSVITRPGTSLEEAVGRSGWSTLGIMAAVFGGNENGVAGQGANAFANNVKLLGLSAKEADAQLKQLAETAGVDLTKAIQNLTELFRQGQITAQAYEDGAVGLLKLFGDLPYAINATSMVMDSMRNVEGKMVVDTDKLTKRLETLKETTDLVKNALQAYWDAQYPDPEQAAKARDQEQKERIAYEIRIKSLQNSIDQARDFGDEAGEALYKMQLAAEQAARQAALAAAKVLSPQETFLKAIRDGLRKSIIDGIISATLESGAIQAVLEPFFTSVKEYFSLLANPATTADELNAALADVNTTAGSIGYTFAQITPYISQFVQGVGPLLEWIAGGMVGNPPSMTGLTGGIAPAPAWEESFNAYVMSHGGFPPSLEWTTGQGMTPEFYYKKLADLAALYASNAPLAMASGGIVTRPTLALLGEAGPEMVLPLNRGTASAGISVQVNLSGPFVGGDAASFDRLGRLAGESALRTLKQNTLLG